MSSVPHLTTKNFKVWLAGRAVYRPQAKALFEQLSEGVADKTGKGDAWGKLRDVVSRSVS